MGKREGMKKPNIKDTVPVLIDSVKDLEGFKMARCMYFSIECDTPSTGWQLELESGDLPFLMLGLSGIITRPVKGHNFKSVEDIETLFESIEMHENLFIDINDIWLPLIVLQDNVKRSSVYRIPFELFNIAYDYTSGRTSMDEYMKQARGHQVSMAKKILGMPEGKKMQQWRIESEDIESKIFTSWQDKAISERKDMKLYEAHVSYALGRKPEKNNE
jgi:hypothetical protein